MTHGDAPKRLLVRLLRELARSLCSARYAPLSTPACRRIDGCGSLDECIRLLEVFENHDPPTLAVMLTGELCDS